MLYVTHTMTTDCVLTSFILRLVLVLPFLIPDVVGNRIDNIGSAGHVIQIYAQ